MNRFSKFLISLCLVFSVNSFSKGFLDIEFTEEDYREGYKVVLIPVEDCNPYLEDCEEGDEETNNIVGAIGNSENTEGVSTKTISANNPRLGDSGVEDGRVGGKGPNFGSGAASQTRTVLKNILKSGAMIAPYAMTASKLVLTAGLAYLAVTYGGTVASAAVFAGLSCLGVPPQTAFAVTGLLTLSGANQPSILGMAGRSLMSTLGSFIGGSSSRVSQGVSFDLPKLDLLNLSPKSQTVDQIANTAKDFLFH